jgi:superfamily II DNA or RNA helicase
MKVSLVNQSIINNELVNQYGFITYGWSFPQYFSGRINDGKCPRIKYGYHYNYKDNGATRMKQACQQGKTSNPEQPILIVEALQQWIIPVSISESKPNAAEKFADQFDKRCNKILKKFRKGGKEQKLKGEEWYDIHIEEVKEIRTSVFTKLVTEYGAKTKEIELNPILLDRGNKKVGLQKMIVNHIVEDFLPSILSRAKGIAPTGLGKTVSAWFAITRGFEKGLLPNRIAIFTAPTQFLAEKNCIAFRTYGRHNNVNMINIPIYSGSDVTVDTQVENMEDRKETLKNVISGYLTNPNATITLHVCSHSMRLLDQVLAEIGITNVDFAIIDEAHTLASTRNNNRNYVLHDGLVKINKRLFITATEKTLANPDNLQEGMTDNYMNNENVYGDYLFQYSYADGVSNKHILPFTCHVFEYSDRNLGVIEMLTSLKEMQIEELEGLFDDEFSISPKMAQSIISSIKIMEEKKRSKLLILCSRNNHAKLLSVVLQHIQKTSNKLNGINISYITADEYSVQERAEAMGDIDQSEEKHIVITGPWAVTGVDCPSLDAVLWNFTPGNEISAAQGIGRGSRIAGKDKKYLTVFFNLDLGLSLAEIQNTLTSTIQKIYEAQFPSHDVVVRERVRRILGRRFLSVDRTEPDIVEPLVRISLNDVYESAATVSLTDHIINMSAYNKSQIESAALKFILDF